MRDAWLVLLAMAVGLLALNVGCGPVCSEGWVATESGDCLPTGDDDDDDTMDDDDDSTDDDDSADIDGDGDGWPASEDCDDGDAALNLDDADADGFTTCDDPPDCDDGDATLNWDDADSDGVATCAAPADCDDGDAALNPSDVDGDGSSTCDDPADCDDAEISLNWMDSDGDGVSTCDVPMDCEDGDAAIYPGAPELIPGNIDEDCDGVVDEVQILYLADDANGDNAELTDGVLAQASACIQLQATVPAYDDAQLAAVDAALYHVVLVEYRTGDGLGGWMGDGTIVSGYGLPTLAMGTGGATLMEEMGAILAYADVNQTPVGALQANDLAAPFFTTPFSVLDINLPNICYVSTNQFAVNAISELNANVLGISPAAPSYGLLMQDPAAPYDTTWYLGLDALGSEYSTEGIQLVTNILLNLGGRSDCTP